jgi:hypothetical protein
LKGLDAQAKVIFDADRAANPVPSGTPGTRPVPPELRALQEQHESLIQSEVASLKNALGPELAARLDAFLQTRTGHKLEPQAKHPTTDELRQHLIEAAQKAKEVQQ